MLANSRISQNSFQLSWAVGTLAAKLLQVKYELPYETYLNGTKFGGFSKKSPYFHFSDYQNLGHRHYFPQITFHIFYLIMT